MERRTLLASIAGQVFYDVVGDGLNNGPDYGIAGQTVYLDTNGNGSFDGSSMAFGSSDVPKTVPDLTTTSSNLSVTGLATAVERVTVTLSIAHTFDSDLSVVLISPTGTRVTLFDGVGGSGDNFNNTTFDDRAALLITFGNAPFAGTYRPQQALTAFEGEAGNGTWRLELSDDMVGDSGKLTAWSMRFSTGEQSAITDASGNYQIRGLPIGTYDLRGVVPAGFTQTAPASGVHSVNLIDNDTGVGGIEFGMLQPPGMISGSVWDDRNSDGVRQTTEPALAGWTVYVDANNNGKLDVATEMSVITGGQGNYTFSNVPPGTHRVREVVQLGWMQTTNVAFASAPVVRPPTKPTLAPAGPIRPGDSSPVPQLQGKFTKTEVLVSVAGLDGLRTLNKALAARAPESTARMFDFAQSKVLLRNARAGNTLVQLRLRSGTDPAAAIARIKSITAVRWASPNYIYNTKTKPDPREFVTNDPDYPNQYFHTLMQNQLAWDTTLGSANVIVAITDDGFDINHPDLAPNIWTNPGEIAGNSIDDDNNGYVDDVHGWNFSGNTNDVNPQGGAFHGTHVTGIVGGRTNNSIGGAGTAGGVTIMPIRFFGTTAWTSAVIAASYAYAAGNGARIVNTSYGVDEFSNDPSYVAALQYIYDEGVLHFNSAGNANTQNPIRQSLDQSLFIANTNSSDQKSFASNYGWGIDLSAPGEGIYSTYPGGNYITLTGTSMATPNAAGVAALIWSVHPTWTRDQVAAQLVGTADSINANNPSYADELGGGRVNSYRAVTEALHAPRIRSVLGLPAEGGVSNNLITSFTVDVANVFDGATISNAGNWQLKWAGADKTFDTADDRVIPISMHTNYMVGTNRLSFTVDVSVTAGYYKFIGGTGLTDPFGQSIDGNGDGTGGDAFVRTFSIDGVSTPAMVTVASGLETTGADFGNRYFIRQDEDGDGNGGDPNPTGLGTAPTGTSSRFASRSPATTSVDRLFSDTSILAGLASV
ncbi:MAG: S8 family serine peptidase [Anaerolineae bacterium]|nr:S8 family serine peptidase [Phycisphaerae bacterium]